MTDRERLARIVAAFDQAAASATLKGDLCSAKVEVGAKEWTALEEAIVPRGPGCCCEARVPRGPNEGLSLQEVAQFPNATAWLAWAKERGSEHWGAEFWRALVMFLQTHEQEVA